MTVENNVVKKTKIRNMVIKQVVVYVVTVLGHRSIYSPNESMCPWIVSIGFLAKIPRLSDITLSHNKTREW